MLGQADAGDNEAKLMTKLAPEWVQTSDPVIRSPARYRWTTAPAHLTLNDPLRSYQGHMIFKRNFMHPNLYEIHVHSKSYGLSVYLMTFDLGETLKGQIKVIESPASNTQ